MYFLFMKMCNTNIKSDKDKNVHAGQKRACKTEACMQDRSMHAGQERA